MRPRSLRFLLGSVRFRLTAWYALLLALVLTTLGFTLMAMTEERLSRDIDHRLMKTAEDIHQAIAEAGLRVQVDDGQPTLVGIRTELDNFAKRGLVIQVSDGHDTIVESSPYAPATALLAQDPSAETMEPLTRTVVIEGADTRVVRYPFSHTVDWLPADVSGAVIVGESMEPMYDTLSSLRRTLLTTSLGGLALAVIGGWLLADRALRPVDRITATAATIASGDGSAASLSTRLGVPDTGDEISRLASTFNAMLSRLEAAFQAQQRFVADASHELRTPLTAIRGNVDVLARQVSAGGLDRAASDDLGAALNDMKRESARMGRLLDDLLLLARADAPTVDSHRPRPVRLDEIARDAMRNAATMADGHHLEIVAPEPVTIAGDADRLLQLVLILLENALRHTPADGQITIEIVPPRDGVTRLIVRDTGEGIAPTHLPHLFDRFYRADGARGRATGGMGLGLSIARAIARTHGGEIDVSSAPGAGSTFTVTLPVETRPASEAPPAAEEARGHQAATRPA